MSSTRSLVLQTFKKLHRTRLKVFAGDERALVAGRLKINDEYKKNKNVTNEDSIQAMIKLAQDVDTELRTQVIQAREVRPGVFEARLTEDTVKLDNIPFDDTAVLEDGTVNKPGYQSKKPRQHCQDQAQNK